ncbi:MAG TPA: hypothetical protein VMD92_19720 [Acidobacteriaceae bacterium]|jgi:hypothetical protein|nr:hypothetical protein [Acidobacteriaceae bacterium]
MIFRRENPGESGAETRDEMREIAQTLSLYRSAMRHVAEKQPSRSFVPAERRAAGLRMRLVLVPALGAALAAAVIGPAYIHLHHTAAIAGTPVKPLVQTAAANAQASVDDTQLMNQIDSEVSEDVPDALQPLEDLSDQATTATTTTVTENKEHAIQK